MKKYCVSYQETTLCEAVVDARSESEAANKVREILPGTMITDVWEIKNEKIKKETKKISR